MNDKLNKIMSIFLLFSFFLFNVFRILPIVEVASAEDLDENYIFGTLINASQGGRGGKGLKVGNRSLGDSLSRDNRGGGQRLGGGPQRGDRYRFNPSLVDIDLVYNEYNNFITNNYTSRDIIVPVNKTYSYSEINGGNATGFTAKGEYSTGDYLGPNVDYDVFSHNGNRMYLYIVSEPGPSVITRGFDDTRWSHVRTSASTGFDRFYRTRYDTMAFQPFMKDEMNYSWYVDYLIFSNNNYSSYNIDIIHTKENMPTKQEFINNYTNTFNLEYDNTTNQLVRNDTYISYNIDDFSDDSIIINNDYITNNYEIHIGDNIENDLEQIDYTNILERIINSIKDLPSQIADLMPKPIYEAGTNFWDFLTDSLDNILDFLETLLMALLNLIFPTAEQLEESKGLLDNLFSTFSEKIEFITAPIQSFSSIYGSSRGAMFSGRNVSTSNNSTNLYNRTMVINDTELHILPSSLEPAISAFRMVSTGVVVILTLISIYTRFRGMVKN